MREKDGEMGVGNSDDSRRDPLGTFGLHAAHTRRTLLSFRATASIRDLYIHSPGSFTNQIRLHHPDH